MKIIDNKKDYYDYLTGKWGIDNKVVFDRRNSILLQKSLGDNVETYYPNFLVGDERLTYCVWFGNEVRIFKYYDKSKSWACIDAINKLPWYQQRPFKREFPNSVVELFVYSNVSGKGCLTLHNHYDNPILKDFKLFVKHIPAETVWNAIYAYISAKNDKEFNDNRTDVQKLESYGFDKKTSFRNV